MQTSNLKQFLTNEEIPHYLIWYYISATTGKKTPIGEKNNEPLEKVITKRNINPSKPLSYFKKNEDDNYIETNFTEAEKQSLQKTYTCFLKYTSNIFCIDIDMPSIKTMDDFVDKTGCDLFKNCPYIKGNTKGIHIYVKINNMPEYSNQQGVYNDFDGDLIKINNVWERTDKEVYNYKDSLTSFEFDDIQQIFNIDKLNFKNREPKVKTLIKVKKNIIKKSEQIVNPKTFKKIEKLIQCFSRERATEYGLWLNTMFMIANELEEDGEELFIEFSKKSSNYNESSCRNNYREYLRNPKDEDKKLVGIGSGFRWAKDDNKILFDDLFPSHYISILDLMDVYETSIIISKTLQKSLVLCSEEWYMLDNKTQLWNKQKEPSFYIIMELRKYIDYSNKQIVKEIALTEGEEKEKLIEQSKQYLSAYNYFNRPATLSVVVKYLRPQLTDNNFSSKLDANSGYLAFKNGIYDLKENVFRKGILSSDFITDTIPFNYEKSDDNKKTYLRGKLKEIMNNNDEHLEYWLSIIGYSFIGNAHLEKAFYCCIDGTDLSKGDNGKTLFYEILTMLFPCYVYKSDCSLIESDNKKGHKQLVRTKGKRLVWVDEFKQNKKADYMLLKILAEGKQKENEVMYGTTETLKFMFKLFVLSNHKFTIPSTEEAVYNRYNEIPYTSHFDRTGKTTTPNPDTLEFIADINLMDNIINNYKNEVIGLIIEYGHKYFLNRLPPIPKFFKVKTLETRKHNDSFIGWFEDNCEVSIGSSIPIKLFMSRYSGGKDDLIEGMKRMGYKYKKDLMKMGKDENDKHYKGGYEGIKFKEIENDNESEDTDEP